MWKSWIYLDNAATTKTRLEVVEAMLPYFTEYYGNPSSVYIHFHQRAKAVTNAREIIAKSLGAKTNEIYSLQQEEVSLITGHWLLQQKLQRKGQTHHHQQDRASCHPSYFVGI